MLDMTGLTSEGSDTNKANNSCKCIICNYYYFLKVNFRFQSKSMWWLLRLNTIKGMCFS